MTMINVHLTDAKLVLVTDTAAYTPQGQPVVFTTKFDHLPHLKTVVVSRGVNFIATQFVRELGVTLLPNGFDNVVARAPEILRRLHAEWCEKNMMDEDDPAGMAEVFVFGWSLAENKMRGVLLTNTAGPDGQRFDFEAHPMGNCTILAPPPEGMPMQLHKAKIPDDLVRHADAQQKRSIAELGQKGIGGELIMLEMTKFKAEIRTVGKFKDFDETVWQMAAFDPAEWAAQQLEDRGIGMADLIGAVKSGALVD